MKIDFIVCTNDEIRFMECKEYIEHIWMPEGTSTKIVEITDAPGLAEGYEFGRQQSDADYKVYLHQDIYITNQNFVSDVLRIFQSNEKIGVIGVMGGNNITEQSIPWYTWDYGTIIGCEGISERHLFFGEVTELCQEVDCLDGALLVTRYDVPWRKDIFTGWHFYDRSICMEYRRRGFLSVVARQERPWCIHDCGFSNLLGWNENLDIFLQEYEDYFDKAKVKENTILVDEAVQLQLENIAQNIELLIEHGMTTDAVEFVNQVKAAGAMMNKQIVFFSNLLELEAAEPNSKVFLQEEICGRKKEKYVLAATGLRRLAYGLEPTKEQENILEVLSQQEKEVIVHHELSVHQEMWEALGVFH